MLQQNASFGPLVLDLNRKRSAFAAKVDHLTGLPLWVNPQIPEQDGTASAGTSLLTTVLLLACLLWMGGSV